MRSSLATILSLLALVVSAAIPAGATTVLEESSQQFHLSNAGSGCGADAIYQLTAKAISGGPNCGYVGGLPFSEVFAAIGDTEFGTNTYTATDGALILDSRAAAEGQITILHASGTTGVGNFVIDLSLKGVKADAQFGQSTTIASTTIDEISVGDLGTSTFDFSMAIPDSLDETQFTGISLDVNVRGLHANSGYTSSQGDSFFTLPTLIEVTQ